uniref:hypothetical protein n=1 Tax=Candidatus Thiosymbion oneisti TaxID=589554 RepID=UPI001C4048DF
MQENEKTETDPDASPWKTWSVPIATISVLVWGRPHLEETKNKRIKRHPLCPAEEEAAPPIEEDDGEIGEPITPEPALSFDE